MTELLENLEIDKEGNCIIVSVNPKIYPLDVALSTAYVFTDRAYLLVDGDPSEEIIVQLRPKAKEDLEKLGREFNNELINYANYAVQSIKNARLRDAIMNRVLMTNTVEEEKPWYDDPEGIAVPWEEKFGDKEEKPWEKEDPEEIAKPWEEKYGKDKS